MADRVGQRFGNYRLIRLLGRGGFAEVYLGQHVRLNMQAAIKVLQAQLAEEDVERFHREAETIASLLHPHIVRLLDFDVKEGVPFLVMDYAPNGSLRKLHPKGDRLALPTVLSSVTQIALALQYAHDRKLIHRDVKPENILFGRNNELLLSDFGIAVVAHSTSSQRTEETIGTVLYMAPEQIQGKPRPASDQYALGVVVYEWLCGSPPFQGSFPEIALQHLLVPPPALREQVPTVAPAIEQVVMTALAKEPDQRFATVQAFASTLEQACFPVHHLPIGSPSQPLEPTVAAIPSTQPVWPPLPAASLSRPPEPAVISTPSLQRERTKPGISRRTVLAGLAGLTVVGLVGSITWLARSQSSRLSPVSFSSRQTPPSTPLSHPTPPSPPLGTTLLIYHGHSSWLTTARWSPDDARIASGSADKTVRVWNSTTGENVLIYQGHSDYVVAAEWSPHGTRIASSGNDRTVQVWDPLTGGNVLTYRGHSNIVYDVAWSPDGTRIASCSWDSTVQIWNAASGNRLLTYHGHNGYVLSVAWSPDGKQITSAGDIVQVWDVSTGNTLSTYQGHSNFVRMAVWSPDGTRIASASADGTVRVWDGATGRTITTYRGHSGGLDAVVWSPHGQQVASSGEDRTVQIWNATNGSTLFTYRGHSAKINALGWSHSGTRIVSGDDAASVQVWQTS